MRTKGKLVTWDDACGFGFIEPIADGPRVFVHIKAIKDARGQRPIEGNILTYTLGKDKTGRTCAENVAFSISSRVSRKHSSENQERIGSTLKSLGITILVFGFFVLATIMVATGKLAPTVLFTYFVMSALTFCMYARDKSSAQRGDWRIPERMLHILSSVGGWPGAIIAQEGLRHKTRKKSFRFEFWCTLVFNLLVFSWLCTASGRAAWDTVFKAIV